MTTSTHTTGLPFKWKYVIIIINNIIKERVGGGGRKISFNGG